MGFSARSHSSCAGLHYSVEELVTVRSYIFYLSHSQIAKVHEQVIGREMFIFLTPLSAFLRVLEKHETSPAKARARRTRQSRDWVPRNQYGDGLLTRQNMCVVNWIKSNKIRLLELGFELQQFFYLLGNTWLYS